MSSAIKHYPGECDDAYPEVYAVPPPQPKEKKAGQLSEDMVKQFFDEGFIIVEDYFKTEELDACKQDIEELVEELAQRLYKAGKVKSLYKECGLFDRLTKLENEFSGANIILHKIGSLTQGFRMLWSNDRLLNAVEQLVGPEIAGSPVWNLRTKTPHNDATTVPWHQDSGYLDNSSYSVLTVTAWIPLIDSDETIGCLQMMRKGHKTGRIAKHVGCWSNTWYLMLDEEDMVRKLEIDPVKDLVTCPVKYGGMVLFNNMIPHRSLPNVSDKIRWSLDLRWQDPAKPYGFYGLKEGVMMRSAKDPVKEIDWETFDAVNRNKLQCEKCQDETSDEELDTIITGPWMFKWEITNENRHTMALSKKRREDQGVSLVG